MRIAPVLLLLLVTIVLPACRSADRSEESAATHAREYLYLWTAAADSSEADFMTVLDVTPTSDSARYGTVVATLPVPGQRNVPHHTEHEMPADRQLFANGFGSGETFIVDARTPEAPRLAGQFGAVGALHHPHSFLRLPNGNVLATFQMQHGGAGHGAVLPGGVAELTPAGAVVRQASAHMPGGDPQLRVYSGAVVPALDRLVTTSSDMDLDFPASRMVQLWRLSDLSVLHTIPLPDGPAGDEGLLSAEPRLLADGRTVLVSTFNCGLHLLEGIDGPAPRARLVATFPRGASHSCAIPVVVGNYYLVTVTALRAVVSLDISNPEVPREVGRLTLDSADVPHWIAVSPDQRRVVITGTGALAHRALLATFDPSTGVLALDPRFRDDGATEPGVRFDNKSWPHGSRVAGVPHGAVFVRGGVPR
jgi:hypothetical protein